MKKILSITLAVVAAITAAAQQSSQDSLVRLVSAHRAEQSTVYGSSYRIVKGEAAFLHNNTYLLCDSAAWNVDSKIIEAFGNVKVLQDRTQLTSEQMVYSIEENTARFKGTLVQLEDKDGNTLRTTQLNYNTKDSVATFMYGGAMRDSSGNVIESVRGTYDSKIKTFTFEDRVELYMDSVYMKTEELRYVSDEAKAYFGADTYTWRGSGFIKSDGGWYGRRDSTIYFRDDVYMNDPDYEAWAGEVYYYQPRQDVDMYHRVKILDTADRTIFVADHARYLRDSLTAWLTERPAMVYIGENEDGVLDTLFLGADTLCACKTYKFQYGDEEMKAAAQRSSDAQFDAIKEYRTQKADERAKDVETKMRAAGKLPPVGTDAAKDSTSSAPSVPVEDASDGDERDSSLVAPSLGVLNGPDIPNPSLALGEASVPDSLSFVPSSLSGEAADSSSVIRESSAEDSIAPPSSLDIAAPLARDTTASAPTDTVAQVDSTIVNCLRAYHNVKVYRSDVQAVCDSMFYYDLDSLARMFGAPALWNDVKNQLTAETMQILLKDGNLYRGNMITDARIASEEDSLHYNQIKGTEMVGYFYNNELYRFDALGGASAVFYMVEDGHLTTVNMKEAKSLTALIKDGNARRMLYFDAVKSDAYPLINLEADKQKLKGFVWRPSERPVSRFDITKASVPESERKVFSNVHKPRYIETDRYFDKYMSKLLAKIEQDKEAAYRLKMEKQRIADSIAMAEQSPDTLAEVSFEDTLSVGAFSDTLLPVPADKVDTLSVVRSAVGPVADSGDFILPQMPAGDALSTSKDEAPAKVDTPSEKPSKAQLRARKKAERKALRMARRAERRRLRLERIEERKARRASGVSK